MVDAQKAAGVIREAFARGNFVWVIGNGGSAAMASHFAAELLGDGKPCVALVDSAAITAIANDHAYEEVFVWQLAAVARPGDVVVALTTSGNSENIRRAETHGRFVGVNWIESEVGPTQLAQEEHLRWLHRVWKAI